MESITLSHMLNCMEYSPPFGKRYGKWIGKYSSSMGHIGISFCCFFSLPSPIDFDPFQAPASRLAERADDGG